MYNMSSEVTDFFDESFCTRGAEPPNISGNIHGGAYKVELSHASFT